MATGAPRPQVPASPIRFRRSAARLTQGQRDAIRKGFSAVQQISDDRGYGYHAGIHGLPMPIGCDAAHGSPYFLPWHRAYLYFFELAVRDQVPSASLTWWDWRTSEKRPAVVPSLFEADDGEPNPLADAEIPDIALQQGGRPIPARTVRDPGAAATLPSVTEVSDVLALRDYADFNQALEGLHNRVHVWVGGDMGDIAFAAYDPIFWAHHCMIDRLWRL